MKIIGFLLLAFLSVHISKAQGNFISGYVVKNSLDTLHGYIDYRGWNKNPEEVRFKENLEKEESTFLPTEIKAFGVQNELYVSGKVKIETTSLSNSELEESLVQKTIEDIVFLQTLIKGDKNLYLHKNEDLRVNFYIGKNGGFELLVYLRYKKQMVLEYEEYKNQLASYFDDWDLIKSKLEGLSYTRKSLKRLFLEYYDDQAKPIDFQLKSDKVKTEIGVLAGVSLSTINFKSNLEAFDDISANYGFSVKPTLGVSVNFIFPAKRGLFSIDNDLLYTSLYLSNSFEDRESDDIYEQTTYSFDYSYLKIQNLLNIRIPVNEFHALFEVGMSNGFSIKEDDTKFIQRTVFSVYTEDESDAIQHTKRREFGIILGTGLQYKKAH